MTFKERARKVAPYLVYPGLYFLAFFVFALIVFPYDKVRDRIVAGFNEEQRKAAGQQALEIEDVGAAFPVGLRLKGVRLMTAPPPANPGEASDEKPREPSVLYIDDIRARVSLFGLLLGRQTVNFVLKGLGGEAKGEFSQSAKVREVTVALDSVDVGQLTPLVDAVGLPMEGRATGTIELTMPDQRAAKASGKVEIDIADLAVGDGKSKIRNMLAVPRMQLGTLSLQAEAKEGVLKITKLSAGGKDLELQGEGRVQLRDMAMESVADAFVRFKVNDAYRNKSDVTKSIFGAPGSSQPALLELADPKVKRAKREDGFYAWQVRGALARIAFEPAPQYGGPGTTK